jgi:hypothetical protein
MWEVAFQRPVILVAGEAKYLIMVLGTKNFFAFQVKFPNSGV